MAEPIGYLNLYRLRNGDIECGSSDLYESIDEAKAFNAHELDELDIAKYLGVAAVTLIPSTNQ